MKDMLKKVINDVYGELHQRLLAAMAEEGGFGPRLLCATPVPGGLAIQVVSINDAEGVDVGGLFAQMTEDPDYLFVGMAAMGCMAERPKEEAQDLLAELEATKDISAVKGAQDIVFFQFRSGGEVLIACCKIDAEAKTFEKAELVQPAIELEQFGEAPPVAPIPSGTTIH